MHAQACIDFSQILTPDDLHSDLVLIRKIKRLEQAEARENAESDVEIDSDDEVAAPRASVRNLKAENGDDEMSDAGVPATQGPPRSSNIVDLGDPSDDDDDEDE